MNSYKPWIIRVFALSTLVYLAPPAFNYVIDPWGLNYAFRLDGVNAVKADVNSYINLHKAYAIRRLRPEAIILGSSRAADGIRTGHPAWGAQPAYNLGIDGVSMRGIRSFFQRAHAVRPLKRVVVGLDFFYFHVSNQENAALAEAMRVFDDPLFYFKPYLTSEMLRASRQSRYLQSSGIQAILPNGETNVIVGFEVTLQRIKGHRALFRRSEEEYISGHYRSFRLYDDQGRTTLSDLKAIVAAARRDDVDLRLFISPSHARQWEMIRVAGLWSEFERWKRALVAMLAEDAAGHPGRTLIPLWDFSGYNSITTENVPPEGDASSRMQRYWDSSHYTQDVGDMILDRLFDYEAADRRIPGDFGVPLGADNIDSHLARIRKEQMRYHKTHAADVAEIEALFLRAERTGKN